MKIFETNLTYKGWDVEVHLFHDDILDINQVWLINPWDDSLVAVCGLNMNIDLEDDEILIKNYYENEGMSLWMYENGLIKDQGITLISAKENVVIGKLNLYRFMEVEENE